MTDLTTPLAEIEARFLPTIAIANSFKIFL